MKRIEELEKDLVDPQNLNEYHQVKQQWETLENKKIESIIFRSKVKYVEQGEKNTKYFLQAEKRNYNQKHITKLISENQSEIINPKGILEEQSRYYKNLYSSKLEPDKSIYNQFLGKTPKLDDFGKNICEIPFKIEEIGKALRELSNDKTPGTDGFTTNFYKSFWPDIKISTV